MALKCTRRLTMSLVMVAFLTGCGGRGVGPTPVPPPPPPPETVNGEITIISMDPEPGATVYVRACTPQSVRSCADEPRLTIDLLVDRDIPNATLFISFGGCGFATTPVTPLFADTRATLRTSVIDLSDDGPLHDGGSAALFCPLPARTTRMFVALFRSGEPNRVLLRREFAVGYTFAVRAE